MQYELLRPPFFISSPIYHQNIFRGLDSSSNGGTVFALLHFLHFYVLINASRESAYYF